MSDQGQRRGWCMRPHHNQHNVCIRPVFRLECRRSIKNSCVINYLWAILFCYLYFVFSQFLCCLRWSLPTGATMHIYICSIEIKKRKKKQIRGWLTTTSTFFSLFFFIFYLHNFIIPTSNPYTFVVVDLWTDSSIECKTIDRLLKLKPTTITKKN